MEHTTPDCVGFVVDRLALALGLSPVTITPLLFPNSDDTYTWQLTASFKYTP